MEVILCFGILSICSRLSLAGGLASMSLTTLKMLNPQIRNRSESIAFAYIALGLGGLFSWMAIKSSLKTFTSKNVSDAEEHKH
jgi:hypothetical protein